MPSTNAQGIQITSNQFPTPEMPPKVQSRVLPPKQKGSEAKPMGIKPPTKQQIQANRGSVTGTGATVVKAADLKNLLQKPDPEYQDMAPVDLTKLPPRMDEPPNFQPHNNGYQNYMNGPSAVQQPPQQNQYNSYQPMQNNNQVNYQYSSYQAPPPQQQQQPASMPEPDTFKKKKPSEMTKEEYAEYEKQRERSSWQRLININVWRQPNTFEKNELEDLRKKNPEVEQMYQAELNKKAHNQPQTNPYSEALRPTPKAGDQGGFNPSYQANPMLEAPAAQQYQQYSSLPQMSVPQILPQMQQQFDQNNQIFQQQQSQILELQKQIQQLSLNTQLNQNNMQVVPITNSANQHLLQSVQDLQIELELTKQQANRYQQDIYTLTQEKRALEQRLQQEQNFRNAAETRAASMQLDLEALRAQIADLKDRLERASTSELQNRVTQSHQNLPAAGGFVKPQGGAPPKRPTSAAPKPSSQGSQIPVPTEDPNFSSIALYDIDQIMKNANIILNKYQDFDQSYQKAAGQQVKEAYTNLISNPQDLRSNRGSSKDSRGGSQPQFQPANINDVDKTIEELLQNDETKFMSTQEMNAAPTEIPSSILDQIPDAEEFNQTTGNQATSKPASKPPSKQSSDHPSLQGTEQKQYEREVEDYRAENVNSLLPRSKFNSRGQGAPK